METPETETDLVERRLERIINLSQTEVFENINEVILHKLRAAEENKCISGMYVEKILKINLRSMVTVRKDDPAGTCTVTVNYTALVVSHKRNDLLPLCQIINIDDSNRILCKYKNHTLVWIKGDRVLGSLQVNQMIPVQVKFVSNSNSSDKIVVSGVFYTYPNKFTVYVLSSDAASMSDEERRAYDQKLEILNVVKNTLATVNATAKQVFCRMFYPLNRKPEEMTLPPGAKKISFDKAIELKKDDMISRPMFLEKSQDCVISGRLETMKSHEMFAMDSGKFSYDVIVDSPGKILDLLMNDYITFAKMICEITGEFSSEERFKTQKNVWTIYHSLKF